MTLIIILITYVGLHLGLYKLFEKGLPEEASWKAFVPIYSEVLWCKMVGRPAWHVVLLFVPIIGFFTGAGMLIDLAKSFRKYTFLQHAGAVAVPFIYFPYIAFFDKNLSYLGPAWSKHRELKRRYKTALKTKDLAAIRAIDKDSPFPKKSIIREWGESIVFAIFAAHFIRMFLIEAYTIPTPSMENSLLVGDFLFVSKVHYGSRMPMTPVSFPLLHNTLPFTGGESYSTWLKWGYHRAPALQAVERYDPVVFNFPEGDTIIQGAAFEGQYHNLIKRGHKRESVKRKHKSRLINRPVDKRDHYIKRCVGIPGDILEVRQGVLFVNNEKAEEPEGIQYQYLLEGEGINYQYITKNYGVTIHQDMSGRMKMLASPALAAKIQADLPAVTAVRRDVLPARVPDLGGSLSYPYNFQKYPWNNDNYGPITIPKKGTAITLSPNNIDLYRRIITAYEGHTLEEKGGKYKIDGLETTTYTPEMNYYWMMGDNRYNSADSRSWGFVPDDHVVGKPLFIWMSLKNGSLREGVRWERIFKGASGR